MATSRRTRDRWKKDQAPAEERERQVNVGQALSVDLPDPETTDWRNWPTGNAAAALLDITPMQVQKLWMLGEITRFRCPDNCYRFSPEQLAQYLQERSAAPDGRADPFRDPDVVMKSQEQAMRMLAQAQSHNEKLSDLYAEPINTALRLVQKINERLAERNEALEAKLLEVADLREQMFQQMFDREIARQKAEASEKRKSEAWQLLVKEAPDLFASVRATIAGKDPKTAKQVEATISLLESLDPNLVTALKELDLLSEDQKKLIDRILNPDADKPNGSSSAEEEEQPTGTPAEAGEREANGT